MRKHRKILISRVLILIVAILSVLCILGAVILFFTMMFNGPDSTDPTTPSPSAEVMESTSIEGTIVDATMNTLSIVTDDGRVLAFSSKIWIQPPVEMVCSSIHVYALIIKEIWMIPVCNSPLWSQISRY